jgi:hypothetical protein
MESVLPLTDPEGADEELFACPISRRTEDREDEESGSDGEAAPRPYNAFGLVYLRRVVIDVDVPRMRSKGPFLTIPAFKYIFGASLEDIGLKYHNVGIVPREIASEQRIVTNKTKFTPTYINTSGQPNLNLFNLADKGISLPPAAADSGSDIEDEELEEVDETAGDIDAQISQMWRQFLLDVAMKTPNPRGVGSPSYFTVSRDDRLSLGEALYLNEKLSDMWRVCQYKVGSQEDWKTAFGHMFPPASSKTSRAVQNYTQCKYFLKWKEICATATPATVTAIRRELWKKVYSLAWIPQACQDKLWVTSQTTSGFTRLPPNSSGPAPRILVKRKPTWDRAGPGGT